MKTGTRLIVIISCCCLVACADESSQDYSAIVRRNVFSLIPSPIQTRETNAAPAVMAALDVKLNGIATFVPDKWALLQIQESGKAAKSILLKEGMHEAGVEVVEIDTQRRSVKILNQGVGMTLTFVKAEPQSNSPLIASANSEALHKPLPQLPPPGDGDP